MKYLLMSAAMVMLAACEGGGGGTSVRNVLGLNRAAPDEFKVVSRPPLSVPPEFTLRPPQPGAAPRGVTPAESLAESVVTGRAPVRNRQLEQSSVATAVDPVLTNSLGTTGDALFLDKAGAHLADETIRDQLYQEDDDPQSTPDSQFAIQDWLGVSADEDEIDPKAEAERIRENLDAGKAVNEGEVKTMEKKPESTLDLLF